MWKILVCLVVLVTVWQGVEGVEGDGVLSGYLVLDGDTKCLDVDGRGAAPITSTTQTALAISCIKLYLVEGSAKQKYKILKLAAQTMKLKLVANAAPEFVVDNSETELQFSDGSNLVAAATAGSVASITTMASAFIIQLGGAGATDAACLTDAPVVLAGDCNLVEWYFIAADCEVSDCVTCVDALKCDSCTDGTHVVKSDKSACEVCGTAIVDCTTCSDTTGTAICSACEATKTLHSAGTSCVAECTVDNCKYCDTAPATCDTCDDDYFVDEGMCKDCGTAIVGCTTCSDTTGTATCTECEATKTLHSAGTSCVEECTVDNCKYCDTAPATCDTCDDGYDMDGNTCEEMATTTTSNGSALTTTMVLLIAVVALKSLIVI